MRVLLVNHSESVTSMGGAERSLLSLGESWQHSGSEVEIEVASAATDGLFADRVRAHGWGLFSVQFAPWALPSLEVDAEGRFRASRRDDAAVLALVEHLRATRPDVVVTNSVVNPWGAVAAGITGIPHVWFVREYATLDHGLHFTLGERPSWEDVGFLSDLVVANSEAVRDHAAQFLPDRQILVSYPTVDLSAVGAPAPAPARPDSPLGLVMLGSIRPAKQQLLAVQALAGLRERGIEAVLTIVGPPDDPEYAEMLVAEAERSGVLPQIHFETAYHDDPFAFVHGADVGLMLSRHEAFGRTTLEYLALGKPVVAVRSGGSPEIVADGESGVLVDAEPDSLVDALAAYAEDRALLASHASQAAAHAVAVTQRHPVDPVLAAIAEVVRSSAGRPKLPHLVERWLGLSAAVELMNAGWDAIRAERIREYDETIESLSQQNAELGRALSAAESGRKDAELQLGRQNAELAELREFRESAHRHPILFFPLRAARTLARIRRERRRHRLDLTDQTRS